MPKTKLKFPKSDINKVKVAAELSGVTVMPGAKQIANEVHCVLSTPSTSNYIEFGKYLATVTGNELDGQDETPAKPAKPVKENKG